MSRSRHNSKWTGRRASSPPRCCCSFYTGTYKRKSSVRQGQADEELHERDTEDQIYLLAMARARMILDGLE